MAELFSQQALTAQNEQADQAKMLGLAQLALQARYRQDQQNDREYMFHSQVASDKSLPLDIRVSSMNAKLKQLGQNLFVTKEQLEPALGVMNFIDKSVQAGQPSYLAQNVLRQALDNGHISQDYVPKAIETLQGAQDAQADLVAKQTIPVASDLDNTRTRYAQLSGDYQKAMDAQQSGETYQPSPEWLVALKAYGGLPGVQKKLSEDKFVLDTAQEQLNQREQLKSLYRMDPSALQKQAGINADAMLSVKDQLARWVRDGGYDGLINDPKKLSMARGFASLSGDEAMLQQLGIESDGMRLKRRQDDAQATEGRLNEVGQIQATLEQGQQSAEAFLAKHQPELEKLAKSKTIPQSQEGQVPAKVADALNEAKANAAAWDAQASPTAQRLIQESADTDQRITLLRQQLKNPTADPAPIVKQIRELEATSKANQAIADNLQLFNPFKGAELQLAATLDPTKKQAYTDWAKDRDSAMGELKDEQLRLTSLNRVKQAQVRATTPKAQQEINDVQAGQAYAQAIGSGWTKGRDAWFNQYGDAYHASAKGFGDQTKFLDESSGMRNTTAAQNEFAVLPNERQTAQEAGRIGKKYQVSAKDVLEGIKKPNQPLVQIGGQEKEEAKKVGAGFGEQYMAINQADMASAGRLAKLDRMQQLLTGVQTGAMTPTMTQIQAIGQSFGFEVDKTLPAKQAMEALSNEIALQLRNPSGGAGMPGSLSDKDREFLVSMTPGLSKTPEGNRLIIETARKLETRNQVVAQMARAYRKKNGQFDEGFFDELKAYSETHPLFTQPDLSQYQEIRTTKDGRRLGKKADGTIEEIR